MNPTTMLLACKLWLTKRQVMAKRPTHEPVLSTVMTAISLALTEQNERRRLRQVLIPHYWRQRANPHARWYLRNQLKRLRYLQPKQGARRVG